MKIRPYVDEDLEAVVAVFTASIHGLGPARYSKEQCAAWAPQPPDMARWRKGMQHLQAYVAAEDAQVVGFCSFELSGHIEHLYVAPTHARRGVASELYCNVEAAFSPARVTELFTEASLVARPFFERVGFIAEEAQDISFNGVLFRRFAMRKQLSSA